MEGSLYDLCRSQRRQWYGGARGTDDTHRLALVVCGETLACLLDQLCHVLITCGGNAESVPCDALK